MTDTSNPPVSASTTLLGLTAFSGALAVDGLAAYLMFSGNFVLPENGAAQVFVAAMGAIVLTCVNGFALRVIDFNFGSSYGSRWKDARAPAAPGAVAPTGSAPAAPAGPAAPPADGDATKPASPAPAKPGDAPAAPPVVVSLPRVPRFTGIIATTFGGSRDRETSAYDGSVITDATPGASLPARFPKPPPSVRIFASNGRSTTVPIVDVGPWNTTDDYWNRPGGRPQAESGTDKSGRRTNRAGIDITPATIRALGLNPDDGKWTVSWDFPSYLDAVSPAASAPAPSLSGLPVPTISNHLTVLTNDQLKKAFGSFSYRDTSAGNIEIDPTWVKANIVDLAIPQLRKFKVTSVKVNRIAAPHLLAAFQQIEDAGYLGDILSYDGLWVPRHINHNPALGISRHTYALALDLNANWNAYGTLGAKPGATGSTWRIEPIFAANGFACGRWFGAPHLPASDTDAMHFEYCRTT